MLGGLPPGGDPLNHGRNVHLLSGHAEVTGDFAFGKACEFVRAGSRSQLFKQRLNQVVVPVDIAFGIDGACESPVVQQAPKLVRAAIYAHV